MIVVRPFPRAEPRIHRRVWVKTLVLASSTLCQLLTPPRKPFQYQLAATEPLTPNFVTSTPGHSNTQRIMKPPVLPFLLAVTDEVAFLKQCLGKNVINAPRTIRSGAWTQPFRKFGTRIHVCRNTTVRRNNPVSAIYTCIINRIEGDTELLEKQIGVPTTVC